MNSPNSLPRGTVAVREAFATLRKGWLVIVALCVLGGLAGGLFAMSSKKEESRTIRISLDRASSNQTLLELGVSAPSGPTSADLLSDAVLDDTAKRLGIERDQFDGTVQLAGQPGDPDALLLQTDAEFDQGGRYLRAWLAAIVADRKQILNESLADAKGFVNSALARTDDPRKSKSYEATKGRLDVLESTLKPDVQFHSGPYIETAAGKPTARYAAAGAIGGAIFAIGFLMLWVLATGRVRTEEGLSSIFQTLIVSDMRNPATGMEELRRWMENLDRPASSVFILDAAGGEAADAIASITREWPETKLAGDLNGIAADVPDSASACLILASLGQTGIAERDRFRLELDQTEGVERFGLVLA